MEVGELNAALEQHEYRERARKEDWRLTNYILARPHFDPQKVIPTLEQFHPFPWDKVRIDPVRFIPYDEQIEFAIRKGRQDWIPDHWYRNSENYKHLAKDESMGTSGGTSGAAKPAQKASRKNQEKRAVSNPPKRHRTRGGSDEIGSD